MPLFKSGRVPARTLETSNVRKAPTTPLNAARTSPEVSSWNWETSPPGSTERPRLFGFVTFGPSDLQRGKRLRAEQGRLHLGRERQVGVAEELRTSRVDGCRQFRNANPSVGGHGPRVRERYRRVQMGRGIAAADPHADHSQAGHGADVRRRQIDGAVRGNIPQERWLAKASPCRGAPAMTPPP